MSKKSIIHYDSLVENKKPHRLANDSYYLVYISDDNGNLFPSLFTHTDVLKAMLRAEKNPEDAPKVKNSWFKKFLRGIGVCE